MRSVHDGATVPARGVLAVAVVTTLIESAHADLVAVCGGLVNLTLPLLYTPRTRSELSIGLNTWGWLRHMRLGLGLRSCVAH